MKSKLSEWNDLLMNHVHEIIKSKASNAFNTLKEKTKGLWEKVEKEAEKQYEEDQEQQQDTKEQGNIDLILQEHERCV